MALSNRRARVAMAPEVAAERLDLATSSTPSTIGSGGRRRSVTAEPYATSLPI